MDLVATVWRGRPIAVMERFDVDRWATLVREHRQRRIGVPPAAIAAILDRDLPREWFDGVRWLATGSAPLDPAAARRFADRYGIGVLNGTAPPSSAGRSCRGARRMGAVERHEAGERRSAAARRRGAAGPHRDRCRRRRGRARGQQGRGTVDADQRPGRIDPDGFAWILDRVDDVIVRGGFKIHAGDVEDTLVDHERVGEAVVVGIPDRRLPDPCPRRW